MEHLIIEASKSTPAIHFDPEQHLLSIKGQSYPENSSKFYTPVFAWLKEYLALPYLKNIIIDIEMSYFNSSSSKILMNIFEMLDESAEDGKSVVINWLYQEDDDTSLECGEEFKEDISTNVIFNLVEIPATRFK
ncbi:MAG: DUF1987 domain-containing protein [Desulfamplus sp.]|nr:DUF1987 domain-containing protein [Desulfamplus sp.]